VTYFYLWQAARSQFIRELIRREVKGKTKQTLLQSTSLVERRTMLLKRVQRFREIQLLYMPGLDAQHLAHLERSALPHNTTSVHVEDIKLFMPSELPAESRRRFCTPDLVNIEDRLRYAEAHDSLDRLRHHLRTRTFTNTFKTKNVTGQKHNTRAREVQHSIDDKVKTAQVQYCRARAAVLNLRGPGSWQSKLQVLEQSDVRALNERALTEQEKDEERRVRMRQGAEMEDSDDEDEVVADIRVVAKPAEVGESRRKPSWIWFSTSSGDDMQDPTMRAGEHILSSVAHYPSNQFDLSTPS
jgi:hypothetical protein